MKKLVLAFAVVGFFSLNTAMACGGGAKAKEATKTETVAKTASMDESSEAKRSCAGKTKTADAKKECSSKKSSTQVAKAKSDE